MTRSLLAISALLLVHTGGLLAQGRSGASDFRALVPGFENEHVRVHYMLSEPVARNDRSPVEPPIVIYLEVSRGSGPATRLQVPHPSISARPSWRPGVLARGIHVEVLRQPSSTPDLGEPGTDLPRGSIERERWPGGQLVWATFRPMDYGVGMGRFPSVATFLSDGVIEVWHRRETRRRIGVQAGDSFWFEAGTRITVVDDYPIGAAIVQLLAER